MDSFIGFLCAIALVLLVIFLFIGIILFVQLV